MNFKEELVKMKFIYNLVCTKFSSVIECSNIQVAILKTIPIIFILKINEKSIILDTNLHAYYSEYNEFLLASF